MISKSKLTTIVIVFSILVITSIYWVLIVNDESTDSGSTPDNYNLKSINETDEFKTVNRQTTTTDVGSNLTELITKNDIGRLAINNPDCKLYRGKKESSHLAVVTLNKSDDNTEFMVLDGMGSRIKGQVPFNPNHIRLSERDDKSIIVGVGDLRLNSKVYREPDTDEPLIIYHNEHIVFESNKTWDFDIASDGSSFVVHEPAPGNTSRLIIRNLDYGYEKHFDLGNSVYALSDYQRSHMINYSIDNSEIILQPAHSDANGVGEYFFYPIGTGKTRYVNVDGMAAAILTSSDNGYFVDYVSEQYHTGSINEWEVSRRRIDASNKKTTSLWTKIMSLEKFASRILLSEDGRWLGISSWDHLVLNTETGGLVFKYRVVGDDNYRLSRSKSVDSGASLYSSTGRLIGIGFLGSSLALSWVDGDTKQCRMFPTDIHYEKNWQKCVIGLRLSGQYRTYTDLFYLQDEYKLDSRPDMQFETHPEFTCKEVKDGFGLSRQGDVVSYQPLTTVSPY